MRFPSINPNTDMWLSVVLAVIAGLSTGALPAPPGVSADQWIVVTKWCTTIVVYATFLSPFFPALSSAKAGPLASAKADPGKVNAHWTPTMLAIGLMLAIGGCAGLSAAFSKVEAMAVTIDAIIVKGAGATKADFAAIQADMPSSAKVIIQVDSYAQSLNNLGVLQPAIVAASNLATQNDPKAAAQAVKYLNGALASLHSFAGSSLVASAANGSVVSDPQTFASQLVATATAVRAATRTAVTATTAVTTAPTSAAAVTATAVSSVGA